MLFTDVYFHDPEKSFGLSSKFIASLKGSNEEAVNGKKISLDAVREEANALASCDYEENTKWGKEASNIYIILEFLKIYDIHSSTDPAYEISNSIMH